MDAPLKDVDDTPISNGEYRNTSGSNGHGLPHATDQITDVNNNINSLDISNHSHNNSTDNATENTSQYTKGTLFNNTPQEKDNSQQKDRDNRDREKERERDRDKDRGRDRDNRDTRERERDRGDRDRDRERERDRGGRERERDRDNKPPTGGRKRSRSRSRSPRSSRNNRRSPPRHCRRRSKSKSPSPEPVRKRSSLWDKPPTGLEPAIVGVSLIPGLAPIIPGLPNPNQDRQSRRLYVGNIPAGITEVEMQEFFNTAMLAAKAVNKPGNPVIAVQINVEKSYAFLEMRSHDEATAGMVFDGIMLHGHALKVRRPKDYNAFSIPEPSVAPKPALPMGAIVATNVPDSINKVFVGGLPAHLNEEQVKDLLMTYGSLKAFNLVKDTTSGLSKGFAFCEYLDESVTGKNNITADVELMAKGYLYYPDSACAGLNGMKLGDKQLLVQRASIGAKLNVNINTRVLMLLNMANVDDLRDEDEYAGVLQDVRDECTKFGPVLNVTIPRPPINMSHDSPYHDDLMSDQPPSPIEKVCPIARIYVEFQKQEDCVRALNALGGRRYAGHIIVTALYSQDLYAAGKI